MEKYLGWRDNLEEHVLCFSCLTACVSSNTKNGINVDFVQKVKHVTFV